MKYRRNIGEHGVRLNKLEGVVSQHGLRLNRLEGTVDLHSKQIAHMSNQINVESIIIYFLFENKNCNYF